MGPKTQEDRSFMADKPYRELLGSIMYAQIATRPDLSYSVSTLSKFASNPGPTHWNALTHVLRYIKGTLDYKITYGGEFRDLRPVGYVDADFGGDLDNRRSCSGHVFIQAGGPTVWGTQYQPTVALSTTEAEYMALTRGMKQILWMYSAMDEIGYPQPRPALIWNDNSGMVSLTKNTKNNGDGDIKVCRIASANNLADFFTKSLTRVAHEKQCVTLRLCEIKGSA